MSPNRAASRGVPTWARGPSCLARATSSSGWRDDTRTSCPAATHSRASAPPICPVPMIPIFNGWGAGGAARPGAANNRLTTRSESRVRIDGLRAPAWHRPGALSAVRARREGICERSPGARAGFEAAQPDHRVVVRLLQGPDVVGRGGERGPGRHELGAGQPQLGLEVGAGALAIIEIAPALAGLGRELGLELGAAPPRAQGLVRARRVLGALGRELAAQLRDLVGDHRAGPAGGGGRAVAIGELALQPLDQRT